MREGKVNIENVRFYQLMKKWTRLSDLEKDLVFSWMVGAGGYLDEKELYETLIKELKNMNGVLSL